MAEFTLDDLNAITTAAQDDILHVRNTSGLDKKITVANLLAQLDPVGTIKMFDGSAWSDNVTIVGWYACIAGNSGQGCPDLENQFIKGSAPADVLDTGGSATHTLTEAEIPSHTHSIDHDHAAATTGSHGHNIQRATNTWNNDNCWYARENIQGTMTNGALSKSISVDLPAYTGTSGSTGSGNAHNNEPQYYKLILIRKCA